MNNDEADANKEEVANTWQFPPLLTSSARRKWQELLAQGYRVNGRAFVKGKQQGLITDFGRVLWFDQEL